MIEIINEISDNLRLSQNGLWISTDKTENFNFSEELSADYEIEDDSIWFQHRNNIIKIILEKFGQLNFMLEIGSGNGYVTSLLKNMGINTISLEPEISGLINAQKKGLTNLICAQFNEVNFKGRSIPAVGSFDVLEHVPDDTGFLLKIYDLLSDNGYLFLTVPAYNFLWSYEDEYLRHYRRYTLSGLKKKLLLLDYKIEYSTYFFSFLPLPIFFIRTIPRLLNFKTYKVKNFRKLENKLKFGIADIIINKLCALEISILKRQHKILTGSSIMIVCSKKNKSR